MGAIFDNPSDNTYDAYGKAVAAGQLYNDTLRRNTAFNALAKAYGPEVGDIKLATDAEALKQSQTMDPLLSDQQSLRNAGLQLDNTATSQTNAFNAQNNPTLLQQNKTTADTSATTLQETQRVQHVQQIHGVLTAAVSSLGTSLNGVTDPAQRLQIFDAQIDQLAPQLGVDPTALKHELAQARADVSVKGAAALPEIQQQVDSLAASNLSPEDQAKLGIAQANESKAQAQADAAATKAKNGTTGLTPAQAQKQKAQQAADTSSYLTYSDTVGDLAGDGGVIDKAIAFVKAHPDSTGAVGGAISGISGLTNGVIGGGTSAQQLQQILLPITSNILLDKLTELKKSSANGSSGFGSLSNAEGDTLRGALGSVNQGQSGTALIGTLMSLKTKMQRGKSRLAQAYQRSYGADPEAQSSDATTTPATPAPGATAAPAADPNAVPAGVDPQLWQYLTPDEQKQFQALGGE